MPRIISGSCKGTSLLAVKGQLTRPTADRVKEALFAILQKDWPADGFLDLYAGTGQIGLEAASRGASRIVLVEKDKRCSRIIRQNIVRCQLADQPVLYNQPAEKALAYLGRQGQQFAIIFADPPYEELAWQIANLTPYLRQVLAPDGLFILEHPAAAEPPLISQLAWQRSCQYSSTMLSFYL